MATKEVRLRLGTDAEKALARYGGITAREWCTAERSEVFSAEKGVPTLRVCAEAYGMKAARQLVQVHLADLCFRMGWMDTLTQQEQKVYEERLGRVAGSIVRSYGGLRVTELLLFLNELQDGLLGQTFMLRNVEKVTDLLSVWTKGRLQELRERHRKAAREAADREEESSRAREAITYEEFLTRELLAGREPFQWSMTDDAARRRVLAEVARRRAQAAGTTKH